MKQERMYEVEEKFNIETQLLNSQKIDTLNRYSHLHKKELPKEEIIEGIKEDALKALCDRYDRIYGEYPEHPHEGAALYSYFLRLKKGLKF